MEDNENDNSVEKRARRDQILFIQSNERELAEQEARLEADIRANYGLNLRRNRVKNVLRTLDEWMGASQEPPPQRIEPQAIEEGEEIADHSRDTAEHSEPPQAEENGELRKENEKLQKENEKLRTECARLIEALQDQIDKTSVISQERNQARAERDSAREELAVASSTMPPVPTDEASARQLLGINPDEILDAGMVQAKFREALAGPRAAIRILSDLCREQSRDQDPKGPEL